MVTTLRQFKRDNPDLKGKRIILCEHLKNKTLDNVNVNLWAGENTRILLCPICTRVHTMTVWDAMTRGAMVVINAQEIKNQNEYGRWLEQAGKENKDGLH